MTRAAAAEQVPMRYSKRGGARLGAGRPKKKDKGASHVARLALTGHEPIHVSIKICDHVWRLRSQRCFAIVCAALAGACDRPGFRVVGCSVQDSHLHLLIEAASAQALARGMQAVTIRVAKGLNKLMGRRGKVFAARYFPHVLEQPREVRAARRYVLQNRANHLARLGRRVPAGFRDPLTFGYFGDEAVLPAAGPTLVVEPRTWLMREGWKRSARSRAPEVNCVPLGAAHPVAGISSSDAASRNDRRRAAGAQASQLDLRFLDAA